MIETWGFREDLKPIVFHHEDDDNDEDDEEEDNDKEDDNDKDNKNNIFKYLSFWSC